MNENLKGQDMGHVNIAVKKEKEEKKEKKENRIKCYMIFELFYHFLNTNQGKIYYLLFLIRGKILIKHKYG